MPTLDWIGKAAVVNHHQEVPTKLLHCDSSLSVGDSEAGNLLVEGDNLEALKALLPYYAGKVKCIYIDPPYNTGNESWTYNDNVKSPEMKVWLDKVVGREGEDLSRHDKWLCMMYPRLRLLRDFLSEDGVIFISIDDNEVSNLLALGYDIFGRNNFVTNLIWQKMDSPSSNQAVFSSYHDHTIVFARDAGRCRFKKLPKPEILAAYPIEIGDQRARLRQLRKNGKSARRQDRESMWYPMIDPDGQEVWPMHPQEGWEGRWAIGALGGGLRYCTLGKPLFDEWGCVTEGVTFGDLAAFIFFSDTGSPIPAKAIDKTSLLGTFGGRAVHLLWSATSVGVAAADSGNVLTPERLAGLPSPSKDFDGPVTVYAEGCTVSAERLAAANVSFRQIPYQVAGA